jgi:hypothetical protein
MNPWLSTDETVEAVTSLEMVSETLPKVIDDVRYWKWVLIALHNALQGYMVLALKGTDSFNVLTPECQKQWMEADRRDDKVWPERRLDSFQNLYKKIKKGRKRYDEDAKLGRSSSRGPDDLMLMFVDSQPFKPRGTQTKSVEMLRILRNDFIHFLPKGWLLQVSGLPRVVSDCIDIIEFLAFQCGNILWHEKENETKTKDLIMNIRSELSKLILSYGE